MHAVPLTLAAAAALAAAALAVAGPAAAAPGTFTVFDQLPMFGMYVSTPPDYTPPAGIVLLNNGTRYVTKLSTAERAKVGADLKARLTFHAQCDNYDRLGSLFVIVKPRGVAPVESDPLVEIARWITPFSDYWQGAKATYVFPDADLSAFAPLLRNPAVDIWLGIDGGSNPYSGDPCDKHDVTPDFAAVGFSYSLDLVSTTAGTSTSAVPALPVAYGDYTAVPVSGTAATKKTSGTAIVFVSGHGSASGGDEYKHTTDTLTVNGTVAGTFGTEVNCKAYKSASPDGNPFLFLNNGGSNPRNWCPGALVVPQAFRVQLQKQNTVSLDMDDPSVPDGSYYRTSITLLPD